MGGLCSWTKQAGGAHAVDLAHDGQPVVEAPSIREQWRQHFFRRESECREHSRCEVGRHTGERDAFLPVTSRAVGMHPDAGQFDQVTGPEPVTRSRHGNEFADRQEQSISARASSSKLGGTEFQAGATPSASPVDAMFPAGLVMPAIVTGVEIQARRAQRRLAGMVAHEPQVDLLVGHVRPRAVPQPVRRGLPGQRGAGLGCRAACAQLAGSARKHAPDDRVQRDAREGRVAWPPGFRRGDAAVLPDVLPAVDPMGSTSGVSSLGEGRAVIPSDCR